MQSVGVLFAVLFAVGLATRRHREIRARGNRVSWTNPWVTALVFIAITLYAIAALYVGLTTGHVWGVVGASVVLMLGGQIGAALAIARRWPVEVPDRRR